MKPRDRLDLTGGSLMVAVGLFAALYARQYEFGTLARMGPGFFPQVLGWVLVVLGVSNTNWMGIPLPLDLGPQGMPGCSLRVSPDAVFVVGGSNGSAPWTLQFPGGASFLGMSMYAQALVFDPAANALGATVTNAAEMLLGGK